MDCHKYHTSFVKSYVLYKTEKLYPSWSSYCFLKQSPAGKKSQHLSWYIFHTYDSCHTYTCLLYLDRFSCLAVRNILTWLACPVCSVSSLLIKYIRKNLVKRETLLLFVQKWRDCITSEK